jgi:hypothetical protein
MSGIEIRSGLRKRSKIRPCSIGSTRVISAVGGDRSGGRTAGVVPDPLLAGETAQVPDDEEVGIEPHAVNDVEFIVEPALQFGVFKPRPVAPEQALARQAGQVVVGRLSVGDLEMGQTVALELQIDGAAFSDRQRVVERLRDLAEERLHLGRGAHVVGRVGHAHARRVRPHRAGLNAEQDVLQLPVLRVDVVNVVRRHQAAADATGLLQQLAVDFGQPGDVVVLEFEEEAFAAEDLQVPVDKAPGFVAPSVEQRPRNLAGKAAAGADQALAVRFQILAIDARAVVEPSSCEALAI